MSKQTYTITIENQTLRVTGEYEPSQKRDSINPGYTETFNCEKIELKVYNGYIETIEQYKDISDLISAISTDFYKVINEEVLKQKNE